MTQWEYARLESTERGINVTFTHRQTWAGIAPEAFFHTLGRLGDEGWELVAALPLTLSATSSPSSASGPSRAPETYQLTPDRWLVFKRPQPEPPPEQRDAGADMIKGLVGRQLLKGRLPLP
jgi:hypothetical protein